MWRKLPEGKASPAPEPGATSLRYVQPVENSLQPLPIASPSSLASRTPAKPSSPAFPNASPDAGILTRGIRVRGELTGKGDLVIEGEASGSIRLGESRLTVGASGRVRANIDAREISILGQVEGNIRGRERITLGSSSRVEGDIEAPRIAIEEEAQFKGRVEMGPVADLRERQSKRAAPASGSAPLANGPERVSASDPAEQISVGEGTRRGAN